MYSMFFGYIYPTSISLSLEGKSFYILRVLPISFKDIIREKDLFHMIISIPAVIIAFITVVYKIDMSLYTSILVGVFMFLTILLYSKVHLLLDVIFLNISWENEVKLIKRSIQTIISLVISFTLMFVGAAMNLNSDNKLMIVNVSILCLIIASHILLLKLGSNRFNKTIN